MKATSIAISMMIGILWLATAEIGYGTVINACVHKDGGVRIVNSISQCKANETPLSWGSGYSSTYFKAEAYPMAGYGTYYECLSCNTGDIAIGGKCSIAASVNWSLREAGFEFGPPPTQWCCGAGYIGSEPETPDPYLDIRVDCARPIP
jgi:hypothetical protein